MRINFFARLLGSLLLATIAFCLGVLVGARQGWLQPVVKLTILNQTGSDLTELEVRFKSSLQSGTLRLSPLAAGKEAATRFYLSGEGQYLVVGKLRDGKLVSQGSGYVEPGYAATEVLAPPEVQGNCPQPLLASRI